MHEMHAIYIFFFELKVTITRNLPLQHFGQLFVQSFCKIGVPSVFFSEKCVIFHFSKKIWTEILEKIISIFIFFKKCHSQLKQFNLIVYALFCIIYSVLRIFCAIFLAYLSFMQLLCDSFQHIICSIIFAIQRMFFSVTFHKYFLCFIVAKLRHVAEFFVGLFFA